MTSRRQIIFISVATLGLLLLIIVLLYVGGILALEPTPEANSVYDNIPHRIASDGAPILGSSGAPVTIVVFTDYACPHCARYMDTLNTIVNDHVLPGNARLEMRVLPGLDPDGSLLAAQHALCALEQDQFWQYQEALFALQETYGQTAFSESRLIDAATELGTDTDELTNCTENTTALQTRLQRTIDLAQNTSINSLPAVLIRYGSASPEPISIDGITWTGAVPASQIGSAILAAAQ